MDFISLGFAVLTFVAINNLSNCIVTRFSEEQKEELEINDYQLLLGETASGTPIVVDMKIDSHMLIVGLSNCGKSKLAEGCLIGKDVTIINAFDEDFKNIRAKRIVGDDRILEYLEGCLEGRTSCSNVHYVLIDEMLVLMRNKKIEKALAELLAIARHYNLYIIALGQEGTREVIKCKNLFNVRICMKQLEESSFRTVLGCSVEDRFLKQREFYVVDNHGLRKGKSYSI